MDYYLKAQSEEEMLSTLEKAGIRTGTSYLEDGETKVAYGVKVGLALDIIGDIEVESEETATYESTVGGSTIEVPVFVKVPGYHANLRGILTQEEFEAIEDLIIEAPQTPRRTWA